MGADTKACSLWRTIASQLPSLGGGERCVVCLSSNCKQVWFLSSDRGAIFGGACVSMRECKHLCSKKYTKNRWALLRMPAGLRHTIGDKSKSYFFLCFFYFFFHFCFLFFAFFLFIPQGQSQFFLFVLAGENEKGLAEETPWPLAAGGRGE